MSRKEDDLWWMGLHTFKSDGRFRWSDHSVLNYVSWGIGQPRPISKEPKCIQVSASKGLIVYILLYFDLTSPKFDHLLYTDSMFS